jgi:hypothetical protein
MARHVLVPIKVVNKQDWGDLSVLGVTHEFVGETVKLKNDKLSFAGGHRVRLYHFKKNVHWRISSAEFDITDVAPASPPRKAQRA